MKNSSFWIAYNSEIIDFLDIFAEGKSSPNDLENLSLAGAMTPCIIISYINFIELKSHKEAYIISWQSLWKTIFLIKQDFELLLIIYKTKGILQWCINYRECMEGMLFQVPDFNHVSFVIFHAQWDTIVLNYDYKLKRENTFEVYFENNYNRYIDLIYKPRIEE